VRRFVSAAKIQKNPDTQKNNGEKFCTWTYGVGVLLINKVSAGDDKFPTLYVVSDRMGERDCFAVIDRYRSLHFINMWSVLGIIQ
jgi:hypothetical protein